MSTYAVGDIQGCYDPLMRVLDKARFDPQKDRLWVTGDIINRGPKSLKCLQFIHRLGDSATTVLGNHDLHFLAVAYGVKRAKRGDTFEEILNASDCEELVYWLRHQKLVHWDEHLDFCMVHAGIPPQWSLKQTLILASEVERVLQSNHFHSFFLEMYGNEPDLWKQDVEGLTRLRVITNYLTRMRFCSAEGQLDLENKLGPDTANEGFAPWFSHSHRKTRNIPILFGHWASLKGQVTTNNVFALDTGCVWGDKLSMMRLEDRKMYQCDC